MPNDIKNNINNYDSKYILNNLHKIRRINPKGFDNIVLSTQTNKNLQTKVFKEAQELGHNITSIKPHKDTKKQDITSIADVRKSNKPPLGFKPLPKFIPKGKGDGMSH